MDLTTIFYHTDEFCKLFEKNFSINVLTDGSHIRSREMSLTLSEVMTILIYYHHSKYKTFKDYYTRDLELKSAFPKMPSYNRFIELQKKAFIPLSMFAKLKSSAECDGISFIDSFPLRVSHTKRIPSHKTFKGLAARGKTSMGWFYGFKVHLIIDGHGNIINFVITKGNVADNNADLITQITDKIYGKVYGDKGYLLNPSLFEFIYNRGTHIFTKIRGNMKNRLVEIKDKILLKKRGVIESVGAVLKEDLNIELSRYRNPATLFINTFSALIAYAFQEKKPSIYKKGFIPVAA